MAPRRPELRDALKAYASAAVPVLAAALNAALQTGALQFFYRTRWQPQPSGDPSIFMGSPEPVLLWDFFLRSNQDALQALPEHQLCIDLLRTDPTITANLATLGPTGGLALVGPQRATQGLVRELLKTVNFMEMERLAFNAERFETVYSDLEAALLDSKQSFVVLAPIKSFSCEKPAIDLGDGWSIDRLSDDERARIVSLGMVRDIMADLPAFMDVPTHTVRFRYEVPRISSERLLEATEELTKIAQLVESVLERTTHALRLFREGSFFLLGRVTIGENVFLSVGSTWSPFPHVPYWPGLPYSLDLEEVAKFESMWLAMKSGGVARTKYLDVAIRRFGYKSERSRPEDQTVDLAIAAEALFLTEGEADRAEQAYRLAIRAAHFIESPRWSQRQMFKLMRALSRVRNSVVHGGSPGKPELPDGSEVDLATFNTTVEDELRRAIKKMIRLASEQRGRRLAIDWEGLLFGEGSSAGLDRGGASGAEAP
jgi:hypothetical protein